MPKLTINNTIASNGVLCAICIADGVVVCPASEALNSRLDELIQKSQGEEFPGSIKDGVRALLRTGGFKPSGRNKPASEYLAQAAREGRFPRINNLVDINNYISLTTGLPISLLDQAAFSDSVTIRYGRDEEKYVFNSGGQEIDLSGLICVCDGATDTPLGNPIKDSMQGKIKDTTGGVIAIIYAPRAGDLSQSAKSAVELFGQLLKEEGQATTVETVVA